MSLRTRWNRVDAERWAHWLLATQTFVLVLFTLWTLLSGWLHGLVLLAAVPAILMGLSAWLTAAWRKEEQWAWYVATILCGMRVVGNLTGVLAGTASWSTFALVVFDGLLLTFLCHPDSFARVRGPRAPAPGASIQAQTWADRRS
jgi:hypothetical protein